MKTRKKSKITISITNQNISAHKNTKLKKNENFSYFTGIGSYFYNHTCKSGN